MFRAITEVSETVLPPGAEYAQYKEHKVSDHRGNPLIEALPVVLEEDEALQRLKRSPDLPGSIKRQSPKERFHELANALDRLYIPTVMAMRIQRAIELMLYRGYVHRNPARQIFNRTVIQVCDNLHKKVVEGTYEWPKGSTMLLRGIPGMGKTRLVERCLSLYRPVIYHTEWQGQPFPFQQRVWIKLNCPSDGSVRGLCINFFQELDRLFQTQYWSRYGRLTKYELVPVMANLVLRHGIGILAIDEIQNLMDAKTDGVRVMLNFFVELENTLGLPILLVGTYAADELVFQRYHQRRRVNGEGYFEWTPLEFGGEWEAFTQALWTCQVLKTSSRWTQEMSAALHEVSFGVTDIALRVFRFAQEEAIDDGTEKLTVDVIRDTAKRHCPLTAPIIAALRDKDWENEVLEDLDDVLPLERRQQDKKTNKGKESSSLVSSIHSTPRLASDSACRSRPMLTKTKDRVADSKPRPRRNTTGRQFSLPKVVQEGRVEGKSGVEAITEKGWIAVPPAGGASNGGNR
ncbi:MAG: ATP-binding protein [Nitrospira sp.]|nr:ATP-binding protein [Nitrospira sp.]